MYSILSLTVWVGDERHRFVMGDLKGPGIADARGAISKIECRPHACGAEFAIYVTNNGIMREWVKVSGHQYHIKHDIKEELE